MSQEQSTRTSWQAPVDEHLPDRHRPATGQGTRPRDSALGVAYAGVAVGALAVVGATVVGWRWAGRPPSVRTVTMGPGGWVSFKGTTAPPLRSRRPWWAVLLRAVPVRPRR